MAEIRVSQLRKAFAEFVAVENSSFTVEDGEFFCLLGPSGCGKTTTLRMIAGLELPTAGQIYLGKEDVSFKRASARDIAFVFQMFALYPHMSVRQNIAFPLVSQGMDRTAIDERIKAAASTLQIVHLLDKSVSSLTSGDRQRVALGRAIVRQPKAFMMDEPLGALDAEFRELMCGELRSLHDRLGATTVYVTHDQREAMSMADRIAIMNRGVIEQLGRPQEVYERPASVFVAEFMGSPAMNLLPVTGALERGATALIVGGTALPLSPVSDAVSERPLVYGIRPEHVHLSADSGLSAEVASVEYMGNCQIVTVNTALCDNVRAKVDANVGVRRGDRVGLLFDGRQASLFDGASGKAIRTARDDSAIDHVGTRSARHG